MVIWIFNHYATIPSLAGGTRHYDLAKELIKKGHTVTIFASSFDHPTRTEKHIHHPAVKILEENIDGIRFIWVKTTPYQKNDWRRVLNMLSYSVREYFYAKKLSEKPDVVIGSLMHPFAALIGYMIARKKKTLFYFEERDLWPQTLIDLGKVSAKHPVVKVLSWLERFLYRKAHRIIVLFDKAVDYIESQGISRDKVIYLPNGIDLERFRDKNLPLPPEHESEMSRLKDKFIAIYSGTHGLTNNLDVILDAAKIIQEKTEEIHFLLVGDGPEKDRLIRRKLQEGLNNVTFMSPVPKKLIPAILSQVHVGLLPLQNSPVFKWGISPNKLYDYMSSSLPVILICEVEDKFFLEEFNAGIVVRERFSEKLAEAILALSNDREQARLMGANAREYVESRHSWDMLAEKFLDVLKSDIKVTK